MGEFNINQLIRAGGIGGNAVTASITFSNTSASSPALFTVTGDVIARIIAVCTTSLTSAAAANVEVGISGSTGTIIATTAATAIDAREIWHDASPDSEIEAISTMRDYIITDGNDILCTLSGQVDTGAITFYCIWTGLSSDGNIVAA